MKPIDNLITRYPQLTHCRNDIQAACNMLNSVFNEGNRLFICGNGGSAADALHIVGELMKPFMLKRTLDKHFIDNVTEPELLDKLQGSLPAFALVENAALTTAYTNDCDPEYVFAQQVYAYTRADDCVWGISTSGNSENVMNAIKTAKGRGAVTLGLTGASGGMLKCLCDVCICVPEIETYKIQELHLPVYHTICMTLEEHFWGA